MVRIALVINHNKELPVTKTDFWVCPINVHQKSILALATTDVSWATLVKGPENMMVTCHFNPGSKARGCLVQINFLDSFSNYQENLRIPRNHNSHLTSHCMKVSPESHPRTIIVKDWKMDGRTGSLSVATFTDDRQESPCTYVVLYFCTYFLNTYDFYGFNYIMRRLQ